MVTMTDRRFQVKQKAGLEEGIMLKGAKSNVRLWGNQMGILRFKTSLQA